MCYSKKKTFYSFHAISQNHTWTIFLNSSFVDTQYTVLRCEYTSLFEQIYLTLVAPTH